MTTTATQVEKSQVEDEEDQASPPQPEVCREACPYCQNTGWVKVFTPWGCPTSQRCQCATEARGEVDQPE